jgi:hypothetical protein
VRRPQEKGHVESLIGYARRNYLVPIPETDSLESLNIELEQRCRQDLSRTLRGKSATKAALLAAEQTWFLELAKQEFEARRVKPARANSLSLVRFECNDYSVPTQYAHHDVTVIGGIEEVRLVVGDRLVAQHPRHWGKEHTEFNPVHYLALLERKPGALDYAKPLENWKLPDCLIVLRRRQEAELEKHVPLHQLAEAVEYALSIGANSVDAVKLILQSRQEHPVRLFCLDGHPHLQGVHVPPPNLEAYGSLCVGA